MKFLRYLTPIILLSALSLVSTAAARVEFGASDFQVSEFRDVAKLDEMCAAPAATSFWCGREDATLTRIPTKGVDYFFDEAGELVAVYAKQQKGQNLGGNYSLDNRQNLIPKGSPLPGGALLLDGEYVVPQDATASWERLNDTEIQGTFQFRIDGLRVEKKVRVSNVTHTFDVAVAVQRPDGEEVAATEPTMVQYAFAGIGRSDSPAVKIGQASSATLNPVSQPVSAPSYISLQSNNRNTGYAIVMRPAAPYAPDLSLGDVGDAAGEATTADISAQSLPSAAIALQKPLPAEAGAAVRMDLVAYQGPNELVRFTQEGYADLPELFKPNILGRLSLGIIWVLQRIHDVVGSWGLSIIVLTLLFRALIWPLISTQTKSMYGMQQLQPRIQALQKKYKDDREKLTQETMALYKESGVNPAGGCLPILLQMPLFIILWRVFVNFEFNQGFLWLHDLGQPDAFYILPALYVGVMVAQSYFATRSNPQQLRQQILINVVFVFIMIGFPAGVILYYVVSMGVQVLQYWLLSRNQPAPAAAK